MRHRTKVAVVATKMGRNGTRSGRKKLKEDGVDLLNSIADAAFDFAAKAPIEYGKECHEYLDILSQAEDFR